MPQNCVILEDLIANGTQFEARDDRGKTALMIANANENIQAVNTLLKYGSNTYSSDEDMRHSFKVSRNNIRNNRSFHTETDSADSWPDTEEEDNNYERPVTKESNKSRKESFKSNSFRVSSLVDETIVEELKTDDNNEENDDYVICKPSTSREENVGGVDNQNKQKDIKLIWNKSSSSSEDDINKSNECGTLGRTDTLKVGQEVLAKNAINQSKENEHQKEMDSDPFNADVMDELELLLMQDQTGHERNVDFIEQMKNLLEEEPPKPKDTDFRSPPTQPLESPPDTKPVNVKTEPTVNQVTSKQSVDTNSDKKESPISVANSGHKSLNKLRRESKVEAEDLPTPAKTNNEEVRRRSYSEFKQNGNHAIKSFDNRRRSYAEVVAQKSNKQMFMDELKSISARAKSYADVVSPSVSPEFETSKETKIPIFRANSNSSPNRHNIQRQTSNHSIHSKSPKRTQNGRQSLVESNNAINNTINTNTNNNSINNNNKVLSKIPLPVKQSPTDSVRPYPCETQTSTSDDSLVTEDESKREAMPTNQVSDSSPKSNGRVKTGALRSSKLRRKVNELNDELKRGLNEKSLLMSENKTIKNQLSDLNEKIREESHHKFELEKRLIKLESELSQYKIECDMKCKENNAIKSELEQIVTTFEDNQKQCRYLEDENQKMKNKLKSMELEEEVLHQKLQQKLCQQKEPIEAVCDHEELVIEWKSRLDELSTENNRLKREVEDLQKISIEKQLDYERELFEWQKRNLEIDADLKRLQLEIQVNSLKSTPEEQMELLKAVRDLNHLMAKLDERITKNEEQMYYKSRNFNEEMFECARNLLDQMRLELTNFKDMLSNSANRDDKSENEEKQLNAFESRIAELRSSLEKLEDQIQSQELQLIRQSDIISFASPLRKSSSSRELFISSNNKPKSWFVQTLFRLQSHIQSTAPTCESITAFAHQKTRLQKQIHELKSELGIFAESVH